MKKFILSVFALAAVVSASAESKLEVSGGADLVSDYVVRGLDQGAGASIQPNLTFSLGGLSIGAWGSTSLTNYDSKELDFILGYEIGNFSVSFIDYWWDGKVNSIDGSGPKYFNAGLHYGEVTLAYTLCEKFPLTLSASTYVYGDDKTRDGDQAYSTYLNVSYPFSIKEFDLGVGMGFATYKYGVYGIADDRSCITDISLSASRDVKITENFSLPLFVDVILAPAYNDAFFIIGMSFNL